MRKGQTFNVKPLSTKTSGIHFPMYFMVMCSGLEWPAPSTSKSFSVKVITCWARLGVSKATMVSGVVFRSISMQDKARPG